MAEFVLKCNLLEFPATISFFSFVRLHLYGLHRKMASVQDAKFCLWKKFLDDITFLFGESAESFKSLSKTLIIFILLP